MAPLMRVERCTAWSIPDVYRCIDWSKNVQIVSPIEIHILQLEGFKAMRKNVNATQRYLDNAKL